MESGFYIKEFEARGKNVQSSKLSLHKGCNAILGKSDTGKTTLFTIIDYVLGKGSTDLSLPPEGDGYTDFFLEVHTYNEDIYTFKRSLGSKFIYVSKCSLINWDSSQSITKYSCSSNSNISFSDFILSVSKIPEIKSKSSDKRNPSKISFPIIRHLFMVDESRVAEKDRSPLVYNSIPSQQWLEKNFMAYLMSGLDDSEFRPNEDPKEKKSRLNGKIEYLKQALKDAEQRLESLGDVGYISLASDEFVQSYRNKLAEVSRVENDLYSKRDILLTNVRGWENDKKNLLHLIARLNNLKADYEEEMNKLQFINSGNALISQLKDVECPLCGFSIPHNRIGNIESSKYAEAIRNEFNEVYYKHSDLKLLITEKDSEIKEICSNIDEAKKQILEIDSSIATLHPNVDELKTILEKAESNLKKKFLHSELEAEIKDKTQLIIKLQEDLKSIKNETTGQREEINQEFLKLVKYNLVAWNFIKDEIDINFNYKNFDILIGNRQRSSYGKGNRSITFMAVMIALLDYCYNKEREFSRLLIMDSPLCTKYGEKNVSEEDKVKLGTIDAFAEYCNKKDWKFQLIVIDNKFTEKRDISELPNINFIDLESRGGLFITN